MKHAMIVAVAFALTACEQRVSAPAPTPASAGQVSHVTDGKKPEQKTMPEKTAKSDKAAKSDKSDKTDKTDPAATKSEKIEPLARSEEEWKQILTPEEYYVLRKKGTERPFSGKYDKFFKPGKYVCAACGLELFTSTTKFDSGCGWPAFYAAKAGDRVKLTDDIALGVVRTEVTCARCGGHLGHIFDDAPDTPTGQRYCINSVSIKFVPAEGPLRENAADAPKK